MRFPADGLGLVVVLLASRLTLPPVGSFRDTVA